FSRILLVFEVVWMKVRDVARRVTSRPTSERWRMFSARAASRRLPCSGTLPHGAGAKHFDVRNRGGRDEGGQRRPRCSFGARMPEPPCPRARGLIRVGTARVARLLPTLRFLR